MSPSYAALFRSPYRALMVAALGATFLGSLDALMVVTALPSAAQDIGGVDLISLAVGATMVTIVMTLPLAGALIDRYGVARSFAIACVLFSAANVLGGLAPSMPVVALSRGVLGLGAGFMFAVPLGLFALYVPNELRPRAFGLNAAMWGVSALIGPALGAALTGSVGWRWVFWVNLPLIVIVAWAARLALQSHPAREPKHDPQPLNVVGPVLLGTTVLFLLAAAREPVIALAALVPAIAFLAHERRTAVPVFTHRPVSIAANVTALAAGSAFLGAEVYLPLQLQVGFGEPVAVVAVALVLDDARVDDGLDGGGADRSPAPRPDRAGLAAGVRGHADDGAARGRGGAADRVLRRVRPGHGHRQPGPVRGGAGRRRRRTRGQVHLVDPAGAPGGSGSGHGRGRHRVPGLVVRSGDQGGRAQGCARAGGGAGSAAHVHRGRAA